MVLKFVDLREKSMQIPNIQEFAVRATLDYAPLMLSVDAHFNLTEIEGFEQ